MTLSSISHSVTNVWGNTEDHDAPWTSIITVGLGYFGALRLNMVILALEILRLQFQILNFGKNLLEEWGKVSTLSKSCQLAFFGWLWQWSTLFVGAVLIYWFNLYIYLHCTSSSIILLILYHCLWLIHVFYWWALKWPFCLFVLLLLFINHLKFNNFIWLWYKEFVCLLETIGLIITT